MAKATRRIHHLALLFVCIVGLEGISKLSLISLSLSNEREGVEEEHCDGRRRDGASFDHEAREKINVVDKLVENIDVKLSGNFQGCKNRSVCQTRNDGDYPPIYLPSDACEGCSKTMSAYAMQFTTSRREKDASGEYIPVRILNEEADKPESDTNGEQRVIVHFVYLSKKKRNPLSLLVYLAIRAAYIRLNPHAIYFHVDEEPVDSPFWRMIKPMLTKVIIWSNPDTVYGQKINVLEHKSDVIRIKALQKYGGIYLDTDIIAMRPLDELLQHPKGTVLGVQKTGVLCNAVIIAERNSTFLSLWMDKYRTDFRDRSWMHNSVRMPWMIGKKHSETLHQVEESKFFRPTFFQGDMFFNTVGPGEEEKLFQFKDNLVLHMWGHRLRKKYLANASVHWIMSTRNALNRVLRPLLPNPYVSVALKEPVAAATLASLQRQSFSLWEVVTSHQTCKSMPSNEIRFACNVNGVWKVTLEPGQELADDFLEKVVNTIGKDHKRFEFTVDGMLITFVYTLRPRHRNDTHWTTNEQADREATEK